MSLFQSILITGASAGIGTEFAKQLAPRAQAIHLAARRTERLETLANELSVSHPELDIYCHTIDLVDPEARATWLEALSHSDAPPTLLINNAGMGDYRDLANAEWPKINQMIQLNITALTHLCHAAIPLLKQHKHAAILNVSSLASVLPIPEFAVYAASKAYVSSLSEALRIELKPHNIDVLALCPGPIHTEFGSIAMPKDAGDVIPRADFFTTKVKKVVADAIRGLENRRPRIFPNLRIRTAGYLLSSLPMWTLRMIQTKLRNQSP